MTSFLSSLAGSLVLFVSSALAAPAAMTETCGPRVDSASPTLHLALGNVLGFGYVHHAFEKIAREFPRAEYCVSGLPLSRNAYQYYQYYVRVDVRANEGGPLVERVRFLYQDASVQAYHNTQGQPWVALDPAAVDRVFTDFVAGAAIASNEAVNTSTEELIASALASRTFRANASELDAPSLSVLRVTPKVSVVSALTLPTANPFAGAVRPFGVLVGAGGTVTENVSLSSGLLFPLGRVLDETAKSAGPKDAWSDRLVELSRVH